VTFVPRTQVHATVPPSYSYSTPWWWTFSDSSHQHCDSGHFGNTYTVLTTWNGLEVCGPTGTNTSVTFPGGSVEGEWQCTELVKRYLYIAYGAPALSNTNGDQVVANYASTYSDLFTSISNTNGNPNHIWPKVGDVISYSDVHTAIINSVTITDATNGNATLGIIEQNASSTGTTTQQFVSWKIKGDKDDPNDTGSDTVTAWLTPNNTQSWSNTSPSGTTSDAIYSMAATSTTSVWAAGQEHPSGSNWVPVTYYNNGSGWTKYMPPTQSSDHHYLYGIASSTSGDTWTVGTYYSYPQFKTLAYHWNSSTLTWTHVSSDSPGPSSCGCVNKLLSVAIDSSGTPWAVGQYNSNSSTTLPLLEKWDGSKFAQQTLSLPSSAIDGSLTSIAFSSSTNGFAVGSVYTSATGWTWIAYHYDGTSWSSYTYGSSSAGLSSVAIVSNNEAWAVGSKGSSPLILHYTTSGWNEDTSYNGYYPSGTNLLGVGTDGANDVWVVGYINSTTRFYTMHYNGHAWVQVNTPSISLSSWYDWKLESVAVNSGYAWAGGYDEATVSSNDNPLVFQWS